MPLINNTMKYFAVILILITSFEPAVYADPYGTSDSADRISFYGKKNGRILNILDDELAIYEDEKNDIPQILSLIKVMETSDHLLYSKGLDPGNFYDIMLRTGSKKFLSGIKNKAYFIKEMDAFIRKANNLEMKYLSAQISMPVISTKEGKKISHVEVTRHFASHKEKVVYFLEKTLGKWYYVNVREVHGR